VREHHICAIPKGADLVQIFRYRSARGVTTNQSEEAASMSKDTDIAFGFQREVEDAAAQDYQRPASITK